MKPIYILGISAFSTDSSAAMIKDGEIIAAVQEERFSRIKHDNSFPEHSVRYCLRHAGIKSEDIKYVVFNERPFLELLRIFKMHFSVNSFSVLNFLNAFRIWIKNIILIRKSVKRLFTRNTRLIFIENYISHAAAAFFPSPFGTSSILIFDGTGKFRSVDFGVGKDNAITFFPSQRFPHSLGLFYSAFTYYCGFKINSGEYKLMGLAPYGEPRYADLIKTHLIDIKEDGSFKLNMRYFDFLSREILIKEPFKHLFGAQIRVPDSEITKQTCDIAASVQKVTEEVIIKTAKRVFKATNIDKLCMSGGIALNCAANGKLLKYGPFKKIWVQPAAGDAGTAIGSALFAWYHILKKNRCCCSSADFQKGSLLGPEYCDTEIEKALLEKKFDFLKPQKDEFIKIAAERLKSGCVIGWFEGRMEFGPRALGARSILADPRISDMQKILNHRIKFREPFRPFAPSVMAEKAAEYFEIDFNSPYMLFTAEVKGTKKVSSAEVSSRIPAVTHVDSSARVQTVSKEDFPKFYRLLEEFDRQTGCPLLINTSFNVRGEPIVCSPQDAIECFLKTKMDALFIGSFILEKKNQDGTCARKGSVSKINYVNA